MSFNGITEKIMEDGSTAIMVRFQHLSIRYPIKNFTNIFGCRTKTAARNELIKVKSMISEGRNPFIDSKSTLNDIWEDKVQVFANKGTWNKNTVKTYTNFYDQYLRRPLGKKKIEKITYKDLKDIHDKMTDVKSHTRNTIRRILSPIFEEYIKIGVIRENEAKKLNNEKHTTNKKLHLRSSDSALHILKKLYSTVEFLQTKNKNQKEEIQMYLYLLIFTAHRKGELIKLKKENLILKDNKIIAPKEMTKTKEDYHYPIPPICIDYFKSIKKGLLFPTFSNASTNAVFDRLIEVSKINLYEGKKLTPHDLRRLMLKVMITECKIDSTLADSCLCHVQDGTIEDYLSYDDKDIEKAYHLYWDVIMLSKEEYDIKHNNAPENILSSGNDNTDKLFKLADLFEKGLLTKEEVLEIF